MEKEIKEGKDKLKQKQQEFDNERNGLIQLMKLNIQINYK